MIFDLARLSIALIFLLYASWSDYKTREVSNKVWLLFGPLAFLLTTTELFLYGVSHLLSYAVCFGLTTGFAIILFYTGGFGGADAKALMCLALALPFYPERLLTPISAQVSLISESFFPISVFTNSVLFAAFTAVALLFYNVLQRLKTHEELFQGDHKKEPVGKKIVVLLTGYKVPTEELKAKWHVYPLEDVEKTEEKELRRKLILLPKDEGRTEVVGRLDDAAKSGEIPNKVWATPGLPMLIFILAGLIATLLLGDIIWILIKHIIIA
jgi:preflagellin peptidase FlaK